jgi:hypothetical protein
MSTTFEASMFGTTKFTPWGHETPQKANQKSQIFMLKNFRFVQSCAGDVTFNRYQIARID